jgi:hypothetical protein
VVAQGVLLVGEVVVGHQSPLGFQDLLLHQGPLRGCSLPQHQGLLWHQVPQPQDPQRNQLVLHPHRRLRPCDAGMR